MIGPLTCILQPGSAPRLRLAAAINLAAAIILAASILAASILGASILGAGIFGVGIFGAGSAQAAPQRPAKPAAADLAMAAAISRFRMAEGLGPVRVDPLLSRAARLQAEAMAAKGVMSHELAGEFGARMRAAGLGRTHSAENLGLGYDTFAEAMEGWKASSGHRRNLLLAQATRVGVSHARGADARTYWALILASPDLPQQLPGGPLFVPFGANLRLQP